MPDQMLPYTRALYGLNFPVVLLTVPLNFRLLAGLPLRLFCGFRSDKSRLLFLGLLVLGLMFGFSLPDPLFSSYYSPVLYDRNGKLLGAMVAFDGQWRFPVKGPVNEKFAAAIVEAEDRRFASHTGVDFRSIARAIFQNLSEQRVVSGGSTITMQTIRLSRPGRRRGIFEKAVEAVLAMRLELSFSKEQILALYAANAPFGANVIGLEAASWRWFGRSGADLSWAEAATLAVLPNRPGLIHPGRNRELLRQKRDALLERLWRKGLIDEETFSLAAAEKLPGEPLPLPGLAPHLLARIVAESGGAAEFNSANRDHPLYASGYSLVTTIDGELQERAKTILERWALRFAERGIMNGACVIIDTESGETLAYVGNVTGSPSPDVDIASAPRSSGSILKPFLYAAMLDSGDILPSSLVSDIPTRVGSYSPENNSRNYLGVVPADAALARSLNVPAVRSLRLFGVDRFAALLRNLGLTTLFRKGDDYGLPLILGGAEVTLWEITGLYAGLGRSSLGTPAGSAAADRGTGTANGAANDGVFFPPFFLRDLPGRERRISGSVQRISPGAAWLTLEALAFVTRPGEEAHWQEYAGSRRIAWKTGTSFGNRDAWAVGTRPDRTAGVWIGNASGEGNAELLSISTSAPVLFELFSAMDSIYGGTRDSRGGTGDSGGIPGSPDRSGRDWFPRPEEDLVLVETCAYSGFPAGPDCGELKITAAPGGASTVKSCPYCRTVTLNETGSARVVLGPENSGKTESKKWFVLPPAEEWYYRKWNLDYKPLPPLEGGQSGGISSIALFNPEENGAVYVPRELDGRDGRIVFQAASRERNGKIYWHLDELYLGMTEVFHEMEARPAPGRHFLTLVDEAGNTIRRNFEVLGSAD
ncbi:MAG: penicillin-binding protein 1C [Treponema sp.]|nr:penicillin-binding protein 1C [Treponema sp.]